MDVHSEVVGSGINNPIVVGKLLAKRRNDSKIGPELNSKLPIESFKIKPLAPRTTTTTENQIAQQYSKPMTMPRAKASCPTTCTRNPIHTQREVPLFAITK